MTATVATAAVAEALGTRLSALDGVLVVFPPAGARSLSAGIGAHDRVLVEVHDATVHVAARLGTARATPSREVLARVLATVREVVGPQPHSIDIEVALIE